MLDLKPDMGENIGKKRVKEESTTSKISKAQGTSREDIQRGRQRS